MRTIPTSIIAFRNGSIGNTLVAIPALRAIRNRYPECRLTVVVDPVGFELLELCPWIDHLVVYDKKGRDRNLFGYLRVLRALRKEKPSHAILFKRFFRNGLLAFLSGAATRVGFETNGRGSFLNRTVHYAESIPIVDLNLKLAGLLDAHTADRNLEVFISTDDLQQTTDFVQKNTKIETYLVAHYGGSTTPPDFVSLSRFISLIENLAGDSRAVFLIGHGIREAAWAKEIESRRPEWVAATDLSLRQTAALIRGAAFFVGFNSGPAHLAAATHTPSIILFKPGDAAEKEMRKWAPASATSYSLIAPPNDEESSWQKLTDDAMEKVAGLPLREAS